MPAFLEKKLKSEYPHNPSAVYGTMNKLGAMVGNKETPKGMAMQAKHDRDTKKKTTVGELMKPGMKPKVKPEDEEEDGEDGY